MNLEIKIMNNFTILRLLKCVMLVGALVLPAVSWADDHFLDIVVTTPTTVSQKAVVTQAGVVNQTLILSSFNGEPGPVEFGLTQSLTPVNALVKMCAPGTNGQLEWLDQGITMVGVTGTLTNTIFTTPNIPNNSNYTLTLSMTGISDTYASPGACTVQGAKTYTATQNAVIDDGVTTILTTIYNFWNTTNLVPEPGTLLLMLIGMLGLGWMSMKRKNQA